MLAVPRLPQIHAAITQRNEVIHRGIKSRLLAQQIAENKNFGGALQSCNRSSSAVICSVVLRSKQDIDARVDCNYYRGTGSGTRLFDRFGNVYKCSQVQIGNEKRDTSIDTRFPQGTPVKVTFTFKDIPSQTIEFDTFEVDIPNDFLKFRNIKIAG